MLGKYSQTCEQLSRSKNTKLWLLLVWLVFCSIIVQNFKMEPKNCGLWWQVVHNTGLSEQIKMFSRNYLFDIIQMAYVNLKQILSYVCLIVNYQLSSHLKPQITYLQFPSMCMQSWVHLNILAAICSLMQNLIGQLIWQFRILSFAKQNFQWLSDS